MYNAETAAPDTTVKITVVKYSAVTYNAFIYNIYKFTAVFSIILSNKMQVKKFETYLHTHVRSEDC